MKLRIALWAFAGALVVLGWTLYLAAFHIPLTRATWNVARIMCPIAFDQHQALSLPLVLIANAATYALIGALVESLRRNRQTGPIAH